MSPKFIRKALVVVAAVVFIVGFFAILTAATIEVGQLALLVLLFALLTPAFIAILGEQPNTAEPEAAQIVQKLSKNSPTSPQPSLKSAIELAKVEAAKRVSRIGK